MSHPLPAGARRPFRLVLVAGVMTLAGPSSGWAQEMQPETVTRVKHATLLVFTAASEKQKGDRPLGSGSGFFINSSGMLITNNHVVDPMHGKSARDKHMAHYQGGKLTWTIVTDAGTKEEKTYEAEVLYQNEAADQAVLQAFESPGKRLSTPNFLRFIPESRLSTRLKVYAFGFPGGDSQRTAREKHPEATVTEGHILEIPRTAGGRIRMIYTDVEARPGNSGGPMVDVDGYLVGTVTLMKPPEGRKDTGGARYSALVPAALSQEMIRTAVEKGKLEAGGDLVPFVALLTGDDGRIRLPGFDRLSKQDALYYPNGDRIHGTVGTDTIPWESPIGTFEVPADAVAYVVSGKDQCDLFLEGGTGFRPAARRPSSPSFRTAG